MTISPAATPPGPPPFSRTRTLLSGAATLGLLLGLVATLIAPAAAQELTVFDLNSEGTQNSFPTGSFGTDDPELGGLVFFEEDVDDGSELFATDGTTEGTILVADLNPGAVSSSPALFTLVGSQLFFRATRPDVGTELWVTTAPGTEQVIDVIPGPDDVEPASLTPLGTDLYFRGTADDGITWGLYRTDTTTLATTEVGAGGFEIQALLHFPAYPTDGSRVYFPATPDGGGDVEIWSSDGSSVGTSAVTSLACASLGWLTEFDAEIYFVCDGADDQLARVDDGQPNGAQLIQNFPGGTVSNLTPSAGKLWFTAETGGTRRLLVHDPVAGTTTVFAPLAPSALPSDLEPFLGGILFVADNGSGRELYWTDGTTFTEFDLRPGASGSVPAKITGGSTLAYFTADVGSAGPELWVTDGTVGGTHIVVDIAPGADAPEYFFGPETSFGRIFTTRSPYGLWVTDGTEMGTEQIFLPTSFSTKVRDLLALDDGRAFFFPILGPDFIATDGTTEGTSTLDGPDLPSTTLLLELENGRVLFYDGFLQLHSTQTGAPAMVEDLGVSVILSGLFPFAGRAFFCADDPTSGKELWSSDGTAAGTGLVSSINSGPDDADPCGPYAELDGHLYFTADDGSGNALWRTDGTSVGTEWVADVAPTYLAEFGGLLYLDGDDSNGRELWISDGTEMGTVPFADLEPGPSSSSPRNFLANDEFLWFTADTGPTGRELWRTDGTVGGTVMVHDFADFIGPTLRGVMPSGVLAELDDELFFSDGSPGTITSLGVFDFTGSFVPWAGHFYFVATDDIYGRELWRTDGTVDGTEVYDLEPGALGSFPGDLSANDVRLYFSAYDAVAKREIHFLDYRMFWDGFESGDTGAWSSTSP